MMPGDRLICMFVDSFGQGHEFSDWPLHLTIVPWFRNGMASDDLTAQFERALQGVGPFEMKVDGEARFGRRKKLVNLIETPSPITKVEQIIRRSLQDNDSWIVDETTKIRRHFRPHITEQNYARVQSGDKISVDRLYIVEKRGDYKEIVATVNLNG